MPLSCISLNILFHLKFSCITVNNFTSYSLLETCRHTCICLVHVGILWNIKWLVEKAYIMHKLKCRINFILLLWHIVYVHIKNDDNINGLHGSIIKDFLLTVKNWTKLPSLTPIYEYNYVCKIDTVKALLMCAHPPPPICGTFNDNEVSHYGWWAKGYWVSQITAYVIN